MAELLDNAEQKCYLFRFFDTDGKLVCSKVGTTTKPILLRIKSELREYEKLDVVTCVIDRIYDCGQIPAEGMESYFRAEYIRRHPTAFRKNDRFFSVAFDLEEADPPKPSARMTAFSTWLLTLPMLTAFAPPTYLPSK